MIVLQVEVYIFHKGCGTDALLQNNCPTIFFGYQCVDFLLSDADGGFRKKGKSISCAG